MLSKQIVILPQIEDLLYPLKSEELAHLEASIIKEGVRDPLVVWERDSETILIDGHHRYAIAQKHNIDFEVKGIQFEDMLDVLDWVDKNQLGRRNLSDEERTLTIGRIYQRVRDQRAAARVSGAEAPDGETGSALQYVADGWNVSTGTIKRASDFASAIELLKSLGEDGAKAAHRILAGDVADGITELPKVYKTDSDKFPDLVAGLCAGHKKIRDIIPKMTDGGREHGKHDLTPSSNQPVQGDSNPPVDAQRFTTFAGDAGRTDEDDFYTDTGAVEAASIPELAIPPIEIQANVLQLFTCMSVLLQLDPNEVRKQLPQYVWKQIEEHVEPTTTWLQNFAQAPKDPANAQS